MIFQCNLRGAFIHNFLKGKNIPTPVNFKELEREHLGIDHEVKSK